MSVTDLEPWDQPVSVSPLVLIGYHKRSVFSIRNLVQDNEYRLVHFTENLISPLTFPCVCSILDSLGGLGAVLILSESVHKKEITLDGSSNHSDRQGLLLFALII